MYHNTINLLIKQKYDSLYDWAETHLEYEVWMTRSTRIHQGDCLRHSFSLQKSVVLALGSFFLLFCLGLLIVQLDVTSRAVLKDGLHWHAGKCLADVTCYSQPVMHLSQVGGYGLCVASQLEAPGAEWLQPHTSKCIAVMEVITQVEPLQAYHGPSHSFFIEMVVVGMVLFYW